MHIGGESHSLGLDGRIYDNPLQLVFLQRLAVIGNPQAFLDQGFKKGLTHALTPVGHRGTLDRKPVLEVHLTTKILVIGVLHRAGTAPNLIYPKAMRQLRDLLRRRLLLVQQRTAQILSLQSMIARNTGKSLPSHRIKRLQADTLMDSLTDTVLLFSAQQHLLLLQQLQQQIADVEAFVLNHGDERLYALLTTIPGIGELLWLTILLETGPIERFPQVGNYSSHARCVPTDKISNGKTKGKGNKENGNRYLVMAFVKAAHYVAIWNDTIRRYYRRKCRRVPIMVAKKAVAYKLTRACYHMLKKREAIFHLCADHLLLRGPLIKSLQDQ